ncbi:MAG TPA: hypothetical protein VHG92_12065 [Afifellaceae bacterium]|nr:hypothetical protein [Afifellaceae bacterium]
MRYGAKSGFVLLPPAAFATFLLVQPELSIALTLYALAGAFAAAAVAPS